MDYSLGCNVRPMPHPSTTRMMMIVHSFVDRVNAHFKPVPTVHIPNPNTTRGMYRPFLDMYWPERIEVIEVSIIKGSIKAPDSSGENESTDWK